MTGQLSALIMARPGQLRGSLPVLLAAIPTVEEVLQADDGIAALAIT